MHHYINEVDVAQHSGDHFPPMLMMNLTSGPAVHAEC
jgi:hypothetical protein